MLLPRSRHLLLLVSLVWLSAVSLAVSSLDNLLKAAGFSDKEIQDFKSGNLVKTVAESMNERELAMNFAFLMDNVTPETTKDMFLKFSKKRQVDKDLTDFGFIEEGTLQEFDSVKLEPNGKQAADEYTNISPGSELNLSTEEIASFNALKDNDDSDEIPQVESRLREMLFNRFKSYREKGLKGIFPYAREKNQNYSPGDELFAKTKMLAVVKKEAPVFHRCLMEYPKSCPDGLEESHAWINYVNEDRPTYALSHRLSYMENGGYIFAERHYYNSRAYNSVQGVGGAFPVKEGTAIIFSTRTSTDLVTGFGGAAKRKIGTRMMGSMVADTIQRIRESETKNKSEL